jgi:endonuclease III
MNKKGEGAAKKGEQTGLKPDPRAVNRIVGKIAREMTAMELPAVEKISEAQAKNPFQILIATLLSARTQDATTHAASTRLFNRARTPRGLAKLPIAEIERLIYPVGFYRTKARHVKACCERLVADFNGTVPATMEQLVTLPGVGRKTANLVLILGFRSLRNICVDIHVHRITNRLGWVRTSHPEETEQALYGAISPRWWPLINLYLVTWGQNICRPVRPRCGDCAISRDCQKFGL